MELTVKEIGDITGGQPFGDLDAIVKGVSTDSRSIEKKQLFVPIIAERNGHDFVTDAMTNGASGHLFSQGDPQGLSLIHI